jgi:hypothetical protein
MTPVYIHFVNDGTVWISCDRTFTPAGTVLGTFDICGLPRSQKLTTITAVSGAVTAVSGANGKFGTEIT